MSFLTIVLFPTQPRIPVTYNRHNLEWTQYRKKQDKKDTTEDPKTVEEVEFKKGMEGYLSLINDDRNNSNLGKAQPSIKLNIVSKLKSNIFDGKEIQTEKKISPKVNKLRKDQLNLSFTKTESATSNKSDLNRTSEKTQQAKQMFENKTGGIIRQVTT